MAPGKRARRRRASSRAVESDLKAYGEGAGLAECETLSGLLGDDCLALAWAAGFFEPLMAALRQVPLADLPIRFSCSDGFATIQLFAHSRATLNLTAHEPRQRAGKPDTVLLVDRESTELLLRGETKGVLHRSIECRETERRFESHDRDWQAGDRIELTPNDGRQLLSFDATILTLQLVRSAENPQPTRKFGLGDGRLLKSASGDKQASRDWMALGVLGAMPVAGSLTVMEQIASDTTRDPDLRWEAVRQALAVESTSGFALLAALAKRSDDPLALPAARLKVQLIHAHPRIAELVQKAA